MPLDDPSDTVPDTGPDRVPGGRTAPAGEGLLGPTCYRHSGRETYLRCTRCDRPICTDCMITASVGFQCPQCVRGANRDMRPARTTTGGRRHSRPGVVTITLIVVTFIMFGLQNLIGPAFTDRLDIISMTPTLNTLPSSTNIGVAYGEWYRLLTAVFVHESILHIGTNMVSLWIVGVAVESRLGRLRFLLTYLVCGFVGSTVSYLFLAPWTPGQFVQSSLGASGAIFGLIGVLAVLAYRERFSLQPILMTIALNVVFTFTFPSIDWHAHLGGLGAGLVLGAAFAYAPRRQVVLGRPTPNPVVGWFTNAQNLIPLGAGVLLLVVAAIAVQARSADLMHTATTFINTGSGT